MTYTIELAVRGKGVQLLALDEEEKDQLLEEKSYDNVYMDWCEKKDYDFYVEGQYLMPECDRFCLTIKDENGNVVFETTDPKTLNDYTYEDGEPQVEGWKFVGVEDGFYLTRIQTLKGCYYTGEFELDEPFDGSKLYVLQSEKINDELMGNDVYSLEALYYQRGEGYDKERDEIALADESFFEEQYCDTYLMEVSDGDYWTNLSDDYGKKCI